MLLIYVTDLSETPKVPNAKRAATQQTHDITTTNIDVTGTRN